jgi:UDP-N-acetyl-2-amino-2-deoxyglucuronate dehydrogenase
MPKQIKVGFITNADGAHVTAYLSALAATEACSGVVMADPDHKWEQSAKKALSAKLTQTYVDYRQMLAKEKPDMVIITLEARLAPPVIDAALDAGCHVFAEKPSCIRAEDFQPLAFKAESKHLNLMLALANRLNPEFQFARELVQSGRIGKIYGVDMHLIADQTRLTRESYQRTWFADRKRAGGGHLIWLGIHWLDLAMHLTGSAITNVTGMINNTGGQPVQAEDSAVATLRFESGFLGTMTSGYYLDRRYHSGIKIWGSKGWLDLRQMLDKPLHWYESGGEHAGKVQEFTGSKNPRGYTPYVQAAVEACANETAAPISVDDSLRALRTVFSIYQSADTGRSVAVPNT